MSTEISKLLSKYQLPVDSSPDKPFKHLPASTVDQIADELVKEYQNPGYRRWYCDIVYRYGPSQVEEWRKRASSGNDPARLFSKYVKEAKTFRGSRSAQSD